LVIFFIFLTLDYSKFNLFKGRIPVKILRGSGICIRSILVRGDSGGRANRGRKLIIEHCLFAVLCVVSKEK
jgi:hypothetical protein